MTAKLWMPKRTIRSFEPDADVRELLDRATNGTGLAVKTVINTSLRRCGPEVVRELLQEMRAKQDAVLKETALRYRTTK